jgi:hypothetical protein
MRAPKVTKQLALVIAVLAAVAILAFFTLRPRGEYATIKDADWITLYEGLPHKMYEPDVLKSELNSKPTVQMHGFAFYRDPLVLKDGDGEKLRNILGDPGTFTPFEEEKKCGGYHPDYAVEWSSRGRVYICLICFGCGEAKVYGRGGEQHFDVREAPEESLKAILCPYRKNRPRPLTGSGLGCP